MKGLVRMFEIVVHRIGSRYLNTPASNAPLTQEREDTKAYECNSLRCLISLDAAQLSVLLGMKFLTQIISAHVQLGKF
jgi:hypothetical protein